jgi:outer membrane protein assembly factor BamE (lipoprotein component of BamABCDE complex)
MFVAACSSLPDLPSLPSLPGLSSIKPYRIDIQQGNFLSPEMVAQLKTGMTREQVRFVLGTPLVADVFHGDRWDYVFYRELGDGSKERRSLSVFFADNKMTHFTSANIPPLGAAAPAPSTAVPGAKAPAPEAKTPAPEAKAGAEQAVAPKAETKN